MKEVIKMGGSDDFIDLDKSSDWEDDEEWEDEE